MRVLGIDTATWTASVGISDDDEVVAERSLVTRGGHGLSLMEMIRDVLADARLGLAEIEGLAVSIGPGSFTGLRVGLSTAKGLALAGGLPIAGVPSLPALALASGVEEGLVSPVLDARRGEVYAALVEIRAGRPELRHEEVAVGLDRWLALVGDRPCAFVGDAVGLIRQPVAAAWTLLPFEHHHPRGALIARLGAARLREGGSDELEALEPRYVRPSEAELRHGA